MNRQPPLELPYHRFDGFDPGRGYPKMKRTLSRIVAVGLLAAGPLGGLSTAQASYPDRPVRMVIPFTPGGGTDILGRYIGSELEQVLGQPIVVENVPGANGRIARQLVAKQPADGYTLMLGSNSTHAIAPLTTNETMADLLRDFAPVSIIANTTLVLAVSATSPITKLADFIAATRQKELSYGTFGLASSPHLMGELLSLNASAPMLHIPYKGSAPAVTDVLGGHTDSVFLTVAAVSEQVANGRLRALAITGKRRIESMPDVPTFAEAGVKGLEDAGWFALFAPAQVPEAIRDQVAAALAKVIAKPEVQQRLMTLGLEPVGSTPAEHKLAWEATVRLVQEIIEKTRLKLD